MEITKENKKELHKNGWTMVKMPFSNSEINKYKLGVQSLKKKAYKNNFALTRCYYPHISNANQAAIESPFNKLIINDVVKEFFLRLELGKAIKELLNWDDTYLQLARLFTMEKYKYRGDWHFDFDDWDGDIPNIDIIQVGLYLQDQEGFRIVKPNLDLSSSNIDSLNKYYPTPPLPLRLPDKFYSEIRGKAGSVLFFAPGLLHQGNSTCERMDFHFRFSNKEVTTSKMNYRNKGNYFLDFKIPNIYQEDFNISNDRYHARTRSISRVERMKNSINYYTAVFNILKSFKYKKSLRIEEPWKLDLFANTIYQD
ncbi:hypothetical protein [Prochlorococcus sp. MIT 1223]|uniref:hypothetical protein n=1 Tax=Prochlorococcus sp. MIT 1223 TaxID=3096217 RepID=UPI002A7652DF|nr:hypothetical protein [Prochlorococcus sp. MIT 1223]